MIVQIHKIITGSRANGPGIRNAVWFQGCTLGCSGCFNPQTHDPTHGKAITTEKLSRLLLSPEFPCEGLTISGGEPFQQAEALLDLLRKLREKNCPPILVFSGFSFGFLKAGINSAPCLSLIDALICGPYRQDEPPAYERFCSSANQELVLLSNVYSSQDFADLPLGEIIFDGRGNATISGLKA